MDYLHVENEKRDKVKVVEHRDLKIQSYLCPSDLDKVEEKLLFQHRSRIIDIKQNLRNMDQDDMCPLCKDAKDTQEHVFNVLSWSKITTLLLMISLTQLIC